MNESPSTPDSQGPMETQPIENTNSVPVRLVILLVVALFVAILGYYYLVQNKNHNDPTAVVETPVAYDSVLSESVTGNPKPLQDFLTRQLSNGVNDDPTRSAIHWVTHRYFDNGGDIYEIYNFIEATPEVAFLRQAETIYPDMFNTIKTTEVANWSYESLMALLAYYEIIDRNGYADLGVWGTAANKYAEQAYKNRPNPNDTKEFAVERAKYFNMVVGKSNDFLMNAHSFIVNNTNKTGSFSDLKDLPDTIVKDDVLVGLNQYASAILNLKGAGARHPEGIDPIELFEFNSTYAEEYVPRLYLFTNYLYATALVYGGEATKETVALPLNRAVTYMKERNNVGPGTILRIINSKTSNESGVFQYDTTVKLAELNPEFKAWLIASGWTEEDF